MRSEKITIAINSIKIKKFIEQIIKDYKLMLNVDYTYDEKIFTLFNTNQYRFTDIRNEVFHKNFDYQEFEEVVK